MSNPVSSSGPVRVPVPVWAMMFWAGMGGAAMAERPQSAWVPASLVIGVVCLAIAVLIIGFVGGRRRWSLTCCRYLTHLMIVCASAAWYMSRVHWVPQDHIAAYPPSGEIAVIGRVLDSVEWTRTGGRMAIDVLGIETKQGEVLRRSGTVRLTVSRDVMEEWDKSGFWLPGDRIRCETVLTVSTGYNNPGCYDPAAHDRKHGVLLAGHVRYPEFITRLSSIEPWRPAAVCGRLRLAAEHRLNRLPSPGLTFSDVTDDDIRTVSKALILGLRRSISPDVHQVFRESGLVHLLAISGLHVGVIAGAVMALLRWLPGTLRSRSIACCLMIWVYSLVAGATPSVIRAATLLTLYFAARIVYRPVSLVHALAVCATIVLAVRPGWITDPGFQLTFSATAGIACLVSSIVRALPVPGHQLRQLAAVSLAAQTATAPVSAFWFGRIGILACLTGMPLIPLTSLALISGIVYLMLGSVPVIGFWTGRLHAVLTALLIQSAHWEAGIPGVTCSVAGVSLGMALLLTACLFFPLRRGTSVHIMACVILIPWLIWLLSSRSSRVDGDLHLWFLDVGNGDASLVQFPDGTRLLIDAGGLFESEYDIGDQVVVKTLNALGVRSLDWMVLTHPHPDHQLGMAAVMKRMPPRELWLANAEIDPEHFEWIRGQARGAGVPIRSLDMRTLHRFLPANLNNQSLVLGVRYGAFHAILPGDAERESEAGLLEYGSYLRATVLKIGHHGSRTSSTRPFLQRVQPWIVTIPCGAGNPFGHPHLDALRTIRCGVPQAHILRSDRHGMIHVRTDGRAVQVTWESDDPSMNPL
ncbi:DNA internalization-related competence protein ComEC/Rec2 [bacterium]|nr:DNA internalization-related competence protein ComEC/Rec2 [candidate division CSSED10-310 bacterium]